jgi:hypothetical protein
MEAGIISTTLLKKVKDKVESEFREDIEYDLNDTLTIGDVTYQSICNHNKGNNPLTSDKWISI